MNPRKTTAFSLLELIAVLAIIAVLGAMGAVSLRRDTLVNYEARTAVRRLALDLAFARRAAIANGDNHFADFTSDGGEIVGYTITRRLASSTETVDSPRAFSSGLTVTLTGGEPEFNFLGEGLTNYTITLAGPDRAWEVTVAMATGAIRAQEN